MLDPNTLAHECASAAVRAHAVANEAALLRDCSDCLGARLLESNFNVSSVNFDAKCLNVPGPLVPPKPVLGTSWSVSLSLSLSLSLPMFALKLVAFIVGVQGYAASIIAGQDKVPYHVWLIPLRLLS